MRQRAAQAGVVALSAGALLLAGWLTPDPRGLGTHEQLALPPCAFYGLTRLPCPTCGLTTAFAHAVRLRLAQAFLAHPFGAMLILAVGALGLFSLACLATGWRAWGRLGRRAQPGFLWVALGFLAASWAFKIGITLADRVTSGGTPPARRSTRDTR